MKLMHLWIPADKPKFGDPRVIAVGSTPRQAGEVYAVSARGSEDAILAFHLFKTTEPDRDGDPKTWLKWESARKRVKLVGNYVDAERSRVDPDTGETITKTGQFLIVPEGSTGQFVIVEKEEEDNNA